MELLNDILIRCQKCGEEIKIHKDEFSFETYSYDHGENGMGEEIEFRTEHTFKCDNCHNSISLSLFGSEYPAGAFNYVDKQIEGGNFVEEPEMGVVYSECDFEYSIAYSEFTRVQQMVIDIAKDPELIYNISSREFEEVVEQVFRDQGFETELTQPTRDGGRDIVAIDYALGKPVVFYVECKKYGKSNSVGVSIVRSLLGVQVSDKINKTYLVTTGHVTRDALKFAEEQNTMISIIDGDEIYKLIQNSAQRYQC